MQSELFSNQYKQRKRLRMELERNTDLNNDRCEGSQSIFTPATERQGKQCQGQNGKSRLVSENSDHGKAKRLILHGKQAQGTIV